MSPYSEDALTPIREIKARHGDDLSILGHHYQQQEIIDVSDFVGDSFKLARQAAEASARYIVFCGVRFMAESARVLARQEQIVQHPEASAGCPMADMANGPHVQMAWDELGRLQKGRRIIPVTYMNSSVELKAFCGCNGGIVCTSSNAERVFDWAYDRGDTIFFFPDEHLGRNTAHARGMDPERIAVWDWTPTATQRIDPERAVQAELIVWKGHCHVHTHFTPIHVEEARRTYPDATIIVHPECPREVVAMVDDAGSTEAILKRVAEAEPGETIVVGTETTFVERLQRDYPEVTVRPLSQSFCGNMRKITPANLLDTLQDLGKRNVVAIEKEVAEHARTALQRMLDLP